LILASTVSIFGLRLAPMFHLPAAGLCMKFSRLISSLHSPCHGLIFCYFFFSGCVTNEQALFSDGEQMLRAHRYAEAYDTFTHYLNIDPASPGGYYNRAMALVGLDRFQAALDDLDRTAQLTPNDVEVYVMRYKIQSLVRQMIRKDTTVSGPARPMKQGLESIYTVAMRGGLDKILQLSSDDVWALNERGRMKHDEGDYDGAVADYNAALLSCDTCTFLLYNKALSLRASWRTREALEILEELVDMNDKDGEAWLLTGECYFALGKRREACDAFLRAMKLGVAEAAERFETLCR
jgi:tetratricopeptide (TPR) repeat protein